MKNKIINSFFKIGKRKVKIKTRQYRCLWHNNEMKCLWWFLNWHVHISKTGNEYFVDSIVIYIGKKKLKILVMIELFDKFKNMKNRWTIL